MQMNLTRRSLIAATPFAIAATTMGAAALIPDPIFAAIERHKATEAEYLRCCTLCDVKDASAADKLSLDLAEDDTNRVKHEFLALRPTTKESARAFLTYAKEIDWSGEELEAAVISLLASPLFCDEAFKGNLTAPKES